MKRWWLVRLVGFSSTLSAGFFLAFSPLAAQSPDSLAPDTVRNPANSLPIKVVESTPSYQVEDIILYPKLESGIPPITGLGHLHQADSAYHARNLHSSVGQSLREVASLSGKAYGPNSSVTPNFRGTGAGHTQVYWNGLPLDQPMLGLQDLSLLPTTLFQETEILFGGNSLNLGTGGIGGAISLSNTYNRNDPSSFSLSQEIGSFGDRRSSGMVKINQFRRLSLRTAGIYQQARNDYGFDLGPGLEGNLSNADAHQYHLMQGAEYQVSSKAFLSGEAWLYDMERGLPPTVLAVDQGERQRDRGQRFGLRYVHSVGDFELYLRSAYHADRLNYVHQVGGIHAESFSGGWTVDAGFYRNLFKPASARISFHAASIRFRQSFAETASYDAPIHRNELTGHFSTRAKLNNRHVINGLWRPVVVNQQVAPAVGSIAWYRVSDWHKFSPSSTRLFRSTFYLQANSNVHFPGLNDLYWVPGGNPDLLPEKSLGVEGGYFLSPHWNQQNSALLNWKTSVFANSVQNWIQWTPDTSAIWHAENVGQVWNAGIESNATLTWKRPKGKTRVILDYAFTHSQYGNEGTQLIYTPRHVLRGRLVGEYKGYRLAWDQDLNSRRFTLRDGSDWLPAYSTANATLGKTFSYARWTLDIQAEVRNVLNTQYALVAWRPMPPRSFHLRAILNFPSFR